MRRANFLLLISFSVSSLPQLGALAAPEPTASSMRASEGGPPSAASSSSVSITTIPGALSGKGASGYPLITEKEDAVCFHVLDLECEEAPTPASDADADVDASNHRCNTVCVEGVSWMPLASQGRLPHGGPEGAPPRMETPNLQRSLSRSSSNSSVSASRRKFYLSSPSGTELHFPIKESHEIIRYNLLQSEKAIRAIAASALLGWRDFPDDAISINVLSGGLSNQLYLIKLNTQDFSPKRASQPPAHVLPAVVAPREPTPAIGAPIEGGSSEAFRGAANQGSCGTGGPLVTKALLRVYGHQQGTALFNAPAERKLFKALGKLGIAPRCLAEFEGGRIETFWEGRPLTTADLTDRGILEKAMKAIASFHEVQISPFTKLPESRLLCSHYLSGATALEDTSVGCSCSVCRLESWGRIALEVLDVVFSETEEPSSNQPSLEAPLPPVNDEETRRTATALRGDSRSSNSNRNDDIHHKLMLATASKLRQLDVERYVGEAAWLISRIREIAAADETFFKNFTESLKRDRRQQEGTVGSEETSSPLDDLLWLSGTFPVLSHNDFQENNIMQTEDGELKLIDFEYSGVNCQAFDLANLFCEATLDYVVNSKWPFYAYLPHQMPNADMRRHLVRVYLRETVKNKGLEHMTEALVTDEVVSRFTNVIDYMILTSHLLWGYWSIIRTKIPEDPEHFSYLDYARRRLELYDAKKREIEAVQVSEENPKA